MLNSTRNAGEDYYDTVVLDALTTEFARAFVRLSSIAPVAGGTTGGSRKFEPSF